jgi:tRNA-Thr(GGU) m(6)t(6)A37 methyltransferase TsaA
MQVREVEVPPDKMDITFHQIGIIHSPFNRLAEMPIQPIGHASKPGRVEVFPAYAQGLDSVQGFSHVILLYFLHKAGRPKLMVTPFLDSQPRGIFATRAPTRPNPIGLSVVMVERVEDNCLYVQNLDILNGTPLLDIKPYVPEFDRPQEFRLGWLEQARGQAPEEISNERFG